MTQEFNYGDVPGEQEVDVTEETVFDDLKAEVSSSTVEDIKWYVVPVRPKMELAFDTNIDFDLLKAWFKAATNRRKKEFDSLKLAYIVLTNQTRGVKINGNEVMKDGEAVTLVSKSMMDIFEVKTPQELIKKVFHSHGYIMSASQKVLEDAGYGDMDIEEGDSDPLGVS